ncbi:MAG: formate/nitrite transporter family protein [Candidatus Saccharibacteria bacterium]|nr:formate/nitrite transporter family protein [Candidatus Saccharibacteria bacterium]
MSYFLTPAEIAEATVKNGEKKAGLKLSAMFSLAILAGIYIALGGLGSLLANSLNSEFGKFLGAAIFPVGLILVVVAGAELFTGDNLMSLAYFERKITLRKLLKSWLIIWLGNFVGALILAEIVYFSGSFGSEQIKTTISLAENKVNLEILPMILRGVLCNILVVLGVWMATGAKDVNGKIWAIWFPVMLFVFAGFEHSVANMFFLPLGLFFGAEISLVGIFMNLLFVTFGNLLGGALLIPLLYRLAYFKK